CLRKKCREWGRWRGGRRSLGHAVVRWLGQKVAIGPFRAQPPQQQLRMRILRKRADHVRLKVFVARWCDTDRRGAFVQLCLIRNPWSLPWPSLLSESAPTPDHFRAMLKILSF